MVRAEAHIGAPRLAGEDAVGVAHRAVVVPLERVEVVEAALLVRVELVEDGNLLGRAPLVAVEARHHVGAGGADLRRRAGADDESVSGGGEAGNGGDAKSGRHAKRRKNLLLLRRRRRALRRLIEVGDRLR